jgi:hypothetical protein
MNQNDGCNEVVLSLRADGYYIDRGLHCGTSHEQVANALKYNVTILTIEINLREIKSFNTETNVASTNEVAAV